MSSSGGTLLPLFPTTEALNLPPTVSKDKVREQFWKHAVNIFPNFAINKLLHQNIDTILNMYIYDPSTKRISFDMPIFKCKIDSQY